MPGLAFGVSSVEWVKVEGKVDEGQKVIVRYETAPVKWEGFKSLMELWTKVYPVIIPAIYGGDDKNK